MALKAAQQRSKVGPIQERLDSCRQFIERAKKRVLRANEVIARAVEQTAIFETEVAQAQQRLVVLEAEAVTTRSSQGVDTNRSSGARARCIEVYNSQAGWWWRRESSMDGEWSSMCGEHSTDAHSRSAGFGTLDVRPQLRSPKRHGVRRFIIDLEDWRSRGSRCWSGRIFESRCADGRPFEIFFDVNVDRDGRCQKTLRRQWDRLCQWPESVMIQARYGFRGVRVGEASHPGPPRRRNRSEDSADAVLTSLEAALTRIDDSDDEAQLIAPTRRDVDIGREGHGDRSVRARIDVASPVASAFSTVLAFNGASEAAHRHVTVDSVPGIVLDSMLVSNESDVPLVQSRESSVSLLDALEEDLVRPVRRRRARRVCEWGRCAVGQDAMPIPCVVQRG